MRTSITLEDGIFKKGLANAKRRGFGHSFSAYLAWLIERDSAGAVQREDVEFLKLPHHGKTSYEPGVEGLRAAETHAPHPPEAKMRRGKGKGYIPR